MSAATLVRVGVLVGGAFVVGIAVSLMLWNGIGPGPLDMFMASVQEQTGVPFAIVLWTIIGSLVVIARLLGGRPGPGTVVAPLLIGPILQFGVAFLDRFDAPATVPAQVFVHALAIAILGVGAGAIIVARFGAGIGELFTTAVAQRIGRPELGVRVVSEGTWLVLGLILGGPLGYGTVMVTLLIGPSVLAGQRIVDTVVSRTSPATIATAPAALTVPRRSPSTLQPISAASSTLDSRSAAT